MSRYINDWRSNPYSYNHHSAVNGTRRRRTGYHDPEDFWHDPRYIQYRRGQRFTRDEWNPAEQEGQNFDNRPVDPYRGPSRFEPGNEWNQPQDYHTADYPDQPTSQHPDPYISQRRNFRGYGPRNYVRSDERIAEEVNYLLYQDPYIDASDIEISVESGEVIIQGSVDSRQSKRFAEDLADTVPGVKDVMNQVRIDRERWENKDITSESKKASNKTQKSSANRP